LDRRRPVRGQAGDVRPFAADDGNLAHDL